MKIELSGLTGTQREFVRQFVRVGRIALYVVAALAVLGLLTWAWWPAGLVLMLVMVIAVVAWIQTETTCMFRNCEEETW